MLAENLENLVKKERIEGRKEGHLEGRQEGRMEGRMEAMRETARNLITRTEMDDTMISDISGLSVDEVTKLRAEARH